jgi:hypothetical protein
MNRIDAPRKSLVVALAIAFALPSSLTAQEMSYASFVEPTIKGGTYFSNPPALQTEALGLLAPAVNVSGEALCGPEFAGNPIAIGDRDRFADMRGRARGFGMGLLSRAISDATDRDVQVRGPEGESYSPVMYEDPIPKKEKTKIKDKNAKADLRLGGLVAADGILISTLLDDVKDDGTVHEIYLERDDCRRVYPSIDYTYDLWGEWGLSVSWSKTTSTYQDGQLTDQQTSSGGFMRSGEGFMDAESSARAFEEAMEDVPPEFRDPLSRYQAQVQDELGAPMWQRLGFGAPSSGARHVGNVFKLSVADLEALRLGRYHLVVQVTREEKKFYQAIGIPIEIGVGADNSLTFAEMEFD